jgi:poly-D-alanine transfer protein DltD
VWVTVLILTWIQYYGLNKDKWEDASKKAMSWLEENGKEYDLYFDSAKLAFGF